MIDLVYWQLLIPVSQSCISLEIVGGTHFQNIVDNP